MALALSLFSVGPKVWKENHCLCARTSLPFAMMTGGLAWKSMVADPHSRTVTVRHQDLWLIPHKWVVPFHDINEIMYTYKDARPMAGWGAGDAIDSYSVGLKLQNADVIHLFRWIGEGEFDNSSYLPDWFYWKDFYFDVTGTQQKESLVFFELLKAMIFPRTDDRWGNMAKGPGEQNPRTPYGTPAYGGGAPSAPAPGSWPPAKPAVLPPPPAGGIGRGGAPGNR
ncbi:MAG: hypothetical protein RLY93_13505 [Sumerlaeia bacterium]